MGILYVVATPIGNLNDITFRALETLRNADLILAEDTRVTKKLLNHYGLHKTIERYDEHVGPKVYDKVIELLGQGKTIALVSDAGTPAISDPGARLVSYVRSQLLDVKIVPVPGAAALMVALSASGFDANHFTFLGYPPSKKGRQKFFAELINIKIRPLVLYESPHRLQKTFESLSGIFGGEQEIVIARELTKIHEEIWKGSIEDAKRYFIKEKSRGEFVLIIP